MSISLPAYGVRSIRHGFQPSERPEAAFHPVPLHREPWYWISHGWSSCHPSRQLSPVLELVFPLRSGAVAQVSAATSWISTNTKSHAGSVSCEIWNVISPPPPGTVNPERIRRL